jgi:hypothetical protein
MDHPARREVPALTPGQGFIVLVGLAIVAVGMTMLPDAYQYREDSGEGMRLALPGALMLLGGLVACAGAALMWRASMRTSGRSALVARLVCAASVVAVLGCVAVVQWIGSGYAVGPGK